MRTGHYTLRVTVDPGEQIAEADETNNVLEYPVEIAREGDFDVSLEGGALAILPGQALARARAARARRSPRRPRRRDPRIAGAVLRVADVGEQAEIELPLPASGWKRLGRHSSPSYHYRGAGSATDPCRSVVVSEHPCRPSAAAPRSTSRCRCERRDLRAARDRRLRPALLRELRRQDALEPAQGTPALQRASVDVQPAPPLAIRAVLWDLDGVLIDSFEVWFHLLNATSRAFGGSEISRQAMRDGWGQGISADVERWFPHKTVAETEAHYHAHFMDHATHLRVDPDARAVTAELRRRGFAQALITNTPSPLAREILAAREARARRRGRRHRRGEREARARHGARGLPPARRHAGRSDRGR